MTRQTTTLLGIALLLSTWQPADAAPFFYLIRRAIVAITCGSRV